MTASASLVGSLAFLVVAYLIYRTALKAPPVTAPEKPLI